MHTIGIDEDLQMHEYWNRRSTLHTTSIALKKTTWNSIHTYSSLVAASIISVSQMEQWYAALKLDQPTGPYRGHYCRISGWVFGSNRRFLSFFWKYGS